MNGYFKITHIAAGFVAVMVGFTSSAVLIFQAATLLGATQAEISSWLLALGVSIALTTITLSIKYKAPILTGWSTPGAALLISSVSGISMPEAIGAFVFCALLTMIAGLTGIFEKTMDKIPRPLIAAMLAGILFQFGSKIFYSLEHQFLLVFTMTIAYLLGRRLFPKHVVIAVLILGIAIAWAQGAFLHNPVAFSFSTPIFVKPHLSLRAIINVAIPLFVVTMTTQNVPGASILNASEYKLPISKLISWIGFVRVLLAPFGCYSINLAAITAAIVLSDDADANPKTRYKTSIFAGICWLTIGLLGATIADLFTSVPQELIVTIAGLALLPTIGNSLKTALEDNKYRDPSLITILLSTSNITLFGIGSAFWGLCAGLISLFILEYKPQIREKISGMVGNKP